MAGDILLYALMDFKKLSVPDYVNELSGIYHSIDKSIGKVNYTTEHNIDGVFAIEIDVRIAKKVIDIFKSNKSVLKYTYIGDGRYTTFMIAIIDNFLTVREKECVKKELLFSIYNILSSRQFAKEDIKGIRAHVNSKYRRCINEYVFGAGLMLFECYEKDGLVIFDILKKCNHKIVDIGSIEM